MMYHSIKRFFDILAAFVGLIMISPLMILIALIVYLQDWGNPIFKQRRVGRDGQVFSFYKFRSMPLNTSNVVSTDVKQLKITPFGKVIRTTNLDELPQFYNVLKGDMSLIGPRPPIESQESLIDARQANGALRLRPGLTGWAQVNAYDYMPEEEKAELDGYYYQNLSLMLDLKIIFKTLIYFTRKPPTY